jgi:hypothetical protein
MMGWGTLGPLPHVNRTPQSSAPGMNPESLAILESWNELDLRLYAEACRRFERKLRTSPADADPPRATWVGPDGFTPDQPLHGYGWCERENFDGRWLCWNSAPVATLDLRTPVARPSRFECLLSHVFNQHTLDRLAIMLNGHALTLRKREVRGGILIESDVPAKAWTADAHCAALTFQCPVMGSPRDLDPASPDVRQLGFALARLQLS